MMVAIKDMEMPSGCYYCHFAENRKTNDYGSFCECGILEDYETINLLERSKHPNCPLVEIITCKDCKHFYCIADCPPSIKVCGLHNGAMRISEKFYCADAERRE